MKKFLCYDTNDAASGKINVDNRGMLKPNSTVTSTNGASYQQLVTDGSGNTKWEDRLAYADSRLAVDGGDGSQFVKVSDEIPSWASVDVPIKVWLSVGQSATLRPKNYVDLGNGSFMVADFVIFISTDNFMVDNTDIVFPEKGVYFIYIPDDSYTTGVASADSDTPEITWDGIIETIKTIDPKYIPDSIIEHENDSSIHVTTEDKSEWTNHISKTNDCIKVCTIKENFPVGTNQRYSGTYGNGKFVFAYSETSVACSTDGITWVRSFMPDSSNSWALVTYGNDKFVAVATAINPIAAYSTDGITWTETSMPNFSTHWSSVTYGNDKFVAVASGSAIAAYSTDGITWARSSMPDSSGGYSVAYGNGKFVATIDSNPSAAAYSIDGITWTRTTIPNAYGGYSVTYGDGKFVTVANRHSVYSIDGITWKNTILKLKTVSGTDITKQVKEALQLV